MPLYRVKVQVNYPGPGGPGLNQWHISAPQDTGRDAAVLALKAFYTSAAGTLAIGGTYEMQTDAIKDPYGEAFHDTVTPWSVAGNAGGNMLPPQTMVCVSWRTSSARRTGMGRTFLGPSAAGLLDPDGTLNSGSLATIRAAGVALVQAQPTSPDPAAQWLIGVYSKKLALFQPITGVSVRDQFAVLRSRRPR